MGHDHLNWLPTDIRIWHSVPGYLYIVWSLDLLVASVCCVSDDALTLWLVRFSDRLILHWHVGSDRILQLRLDTKEITFAGVSTSTEDLLRWQWLREGLSIWQKTVRQGLVSVELFGLKTWPCLICRWSYLKRIFVAWNAWSLYSIQKSPVWWCRDDIEISFDRLIGHSPESIQKLNWFNSMGMVRRSCFLHPAPPNPFNPLEKYDFGIFW